MYNYQSNYRSKKAAKRELKSTILYIILIIMIIDFLGFLLWSASGQLPPDNIFIGIISKTVINLIIK